MNAIISTSFVLWTFAAAEVSSNSSCDQYGRPAGLENCKESLTVQTSSGPVVGFRRSIPGSYHEVSTFRGIPFADPPVGQNRFRSPQPLKRKWTSVMKAWSWSKSCPQADPSGYGTKTVFPQAASEDCLYLNVYTPSDAISGKKRVPVMAWLFGGGYFQGDGAEFFGQSDLGSYAMYDGAGLVSRHGTVIVTSNYRLSGLGFFATDELRTEDPNGSTGNMGLLDQRASLQWIQSNIAGFGGDPNQVTLFGESAGAFSVAWHLVSKPSWPLFHRAIMESGTTKLDFFFQPFDNHSRDFYAEWASKVDCPPAGPRSLPCLRNVSFWKLVDPPLNISTASPLYDRRGKTVSMAYGPTIDGSNAGLHAAPLDLIRAGEFHHVPLLIGSNLDEGTLFEPLLSAIAPALNQTKKITTLDEVKIALQWSLGKNNVDKVLSAYPEKQFKSCIFPWCKIDYEEMISRMVRDMGFDCSNRAVVNAWASFGVPSFLYKFSWAPFLFRMDKKYFGGPGVTHGFELPFVWRVQQVLEELQSATKVDPSPIADLMACKWTTFAFTATPNRDNAMTGPSGCSHIETKSLHWPQYRNTSRQYLSFQQESKVASLRSGNEYPDDEFASDKRCDMWEEVLGQNGGTPWPKAGLFEALVLQPQSASASRADSLEYLV